MASLMDPLSAICRLRPESLPRRQVSRFVRRCSAGLLTISFLVGHACAAADGAPSLTPEEFAQAKAVLAEGMRRQVSADTDPDVTGSVSTKPVVDPGKLHEDIRRLFAPQPLGPAAQFAPDPTGAIADAP